ncbi:MAG: TldD/PmbA family protein [Rhodothermales bacterium]
MDTDAAFPVPFKVCAGEAADCAGKLLLPAIQSGALYADLFVEETKEASLWAGLRQPGTGSPHFRTTERTIAGMALRAFDNDKHQVETSPGWQPANWRATADRLAAGFSSDDSIERIAVDQFSSGIKWVDELAQDAVESVSLQEQQHVLASMIDSLYSCYPEVAHAAVTLKQATRRTLLANTLGNSLGGVRGRFGIRMEVQPDALQPDIAYETRGYVGGFGEVMFDAGAALVREVVERAKRIAIARAVEAGQVPVVFAGGWAGLWLHETVGHLLEADVASLSIGQVIGGEMLTVYDDATRAGRQGRCMVDDEGVPANKTMLVEKGRIANLLTDRFCAHKRMLPLTGNGRRAHYAELPLPRMTNLLLMPGDEVPEVLIASVQRGLYVKQASAGIHHPGAPGVADHCNGASTFELIVNDGYIIERGELAYPVRNVVISGQSLHALQQIVAVGNDALADTGFGVCKKAGQVVPVSVNAPSVLIDDLHVRQL